MTATAPRRVELPQGVRTDARDRRGEALALTEVAPLLVRIVEAWHPLQIWLFGSRARGEATAESDWDLLVIVPNELTEEDIDPMAVWALRKGTGVYADVIPCPMRDFLEALDTPNTLSYEASKRGVLIYEP